jgi:hypothetical protein
MYISLSEKIRKIAFMVDDDYSGDSAYVNIPIYQQRIEPEEDSREIGNGPPSMYEDPDQKDRLKNEEDIRRQGEQPGPVDWLDRHTKPVVETNFGAPFEDDQGKPMNDSTTPGGLNENKDTIGFDPDELNVNPFRS